MTDASATAALQAPPQGRRWLSAIARQREISLLAVMVVLGGLVSIAAPQFLSSQNLTQVAVLASITAVAAIGEALVIITRNVDLSVEAMIGLTAYILARTLEIHGLDVPTAIVFAVGVGFVLGAINGIIVTLLRVPAIVATLGTLSIFRGMDYVIAGSHQVPLAGLPPGFSTFAQSSVFGIPDFVLIVIVLVAIGTVLVRSTRFGRQFYAVGSNPEAAAILGVPSRRVVFAAFSVCGMLAGVAGVLWVVEFGTINGTSATGVTLSVVAAVVVGGVNIFGGSGSLAGAAIGALFLGFIANALILIGLSQFWLQAIYGAVILVAVSADTALIRQFQRTASERRGR
jgi:rhamnose transport system permease protein